MADVKPHGAVGRPHLVKQHVLHLLIVDERGFLVCEISELVSPDRIGICDAVENLLYGVFVFDGAGVFPENVFADGNF